MNLHISLSKRNSNLPCYYSLNTIYATSDVALITKIKDFLKDRNIDSSGLTQVVVCASPRNGYSILTKEQVGPMLLNTFGVTTPVVCNLFDQNVC